MKMYQDLAVYEMCTSLLQSRFCSLFDAHSHCLSALICFLKLISIFEVDNVVFCDLSSQERKTDTYGRPRNDSINSFHFFQLARVAAMDQSFCLTSSHQSAMDKAYPR
jgi:hypothetical protein